MHVEKNLDHPSRVTGAGRAARVAKRAVASLAMSVLALCALPALSSAQDPGVKPEPQTLARCASTISLEGRLVMEQWSRAGECERPVRTRVTDRFLGFTCLETIPAASTCRSFAPPPGSGVFDTSRVFRCIDLAVADTEFGVFVSRMKEWAAPAKACDWSLAVEVPAMEVDFASGEVCVGGLCIFADRLSRIGKIRLRRLVGKAFREFGIGMTASVRARQ
jgi:hypothetical protein